MVVPYIRSEGVRVETICVYRLILAKMTVFYTFFLSPSASITGFLGFIIRTVSGEALTFSSFLYPILSLEMIVDTLVLVGVWMKSRNCLFPWLTLNFLAVLVSSLAIVASSVHLLTDEDKENEATFLLSQIFILVCLIGLLLIFILQIYQIHVVLSLYVHLGNYKEPSEEILSPERIRKERTASDSAVNMYSDSTHISTDLSDDASPIPEASLGIPVAGEEDNTNNTSTENHRESWNTFKFTFDNEKFS